MEVFKMKLMSGMFLLLMTSSLFAQTPNALVARLMGENPRAFRFTENGKVENLKVGDVLNVGEQVMVEIGSELVFKHYNNESYYQIAGGGQARFEADAIELVRGSIWVQNNGVERDRNFIMKSANAFAKYNNGNFVVHYDSDLGKTQVLVLKGEVEFGNINEPLRTLNIPEGKVSQVDKRVSNGLPRNPELIGQESFHQIVSAFQGMKKQIKKSPEEPKGRVIASVQTNPQILFIDSAKKEVSQRVPASVAVEKPAPRAKKVVAAESAPIRVFGQVNTIAKREIASVKRDIAADEKAMLLDDIDAAFVGTLEKHERTQKKYSPERMKLIKELESVSQQFNKEY